MVLSAASGFFKTLLGGSFSEGEQVQQGQPVSIAASHAAVSALLDFIYGGQPEVSVEDSIELLTLADAYGLPKLAETVENGLRAALNNASVATALKFLEEIQRLKAAEDKGWHALKAVCQDKVTANFEACILQPDFLKLSATQLAQILEREDLCVAREEVVLKAVLSWFDGVQDRRDDMLGSLLPHVDFPSFSSENLSRIATFASSLGDAHIKLQVDEACRIHKRKRSREIPHFSDPRDFVQFLQPFRPKRRCLQHWSPEMGAIARQNVGYIPCRSLRCHSGALYATDSDGQVLSWKLGTKYPVVVVVGEGARVAGDDLGDFCRMSISPAGEIYVADMRNNRLVSFQHGRGELVIDGVEGLEDVFCSAKGVYVLTHRGRAVQKLSGSTLQAVMISENLPAELQFAAHSLFVTKEEMIYFSDTENRRILRVGPGEMRPIIMGVVPDASSRLAGLFVTEGGAIYVADYEQNKVLTFHPGDPTCHDAVSVEGPLAVVLHDQALFVGGEEGVHSYLLPPKLQLKST